MVVSLEQDSTTGFEWAADAWCEKSFLDAIVPFFFWKMKPGERSLFSITPAVAQIITEWSSRRAERTQRLQELDSSELGLPLNCRRSVEVSGSVGGYLSSSVIGPINSLNIESLEVTGEH